MHNEILSSDQITLLPLIDLFSPSFCLIGGTAIAWRLGHRRSIDFLPNFSRSDDQIKSFHVDVSLQK